MVELPPVLPYTAAFSAAWECSGPSGEEGHQPPDSRSVPDFGDFSKAALGYFDSAVAGEESHPMTRCRSSSWVSW